MHRYLKYILLLLLFLSSSFGASQLLKGGTVSDGLDVSAIKLGSHEKFTRIVFFVNYWEGHEQANTPAKSTGSYEFKLSDDSLSIEAQLLGFRSATASDIENNKSTNIKSIKQLKGEEYGDDSSVFYKIELSRPSSIKAFTLQDPSRIVLDIGEF
jgi:hypothetical protein